MVVPVLNKQGVEVDKVTIDEHSLGSVVQPALIKQAYVRYHANTRQGSSRTKNRREVEGSTRKLYKQKGTGNARHGDRKVNTMKGGGHAHSKKRTREDYRLDMPKKMRRKANRNALLAKLIDNEVKIIDDLSMQTPRTKELVTLLAALKIDKSALLALSVEAENTRLAARNLDNIKLCRCDQLNCFDLLNNRYLVIGKSELQAWLSGPSSQTGKNAKIAPMGADSDRGDAKAVPAAGTTTKAAKAAKGSK